MKTKENITAYICEYCNKKMFMKSAMGKHEKNCYSNPNNQRACSGCDHLEEIEIEYYRVTQCTYSETVHKTKGFRCKKLDKIMYPFKVEKLGLIEKYPETFEDQLPMPKECEYHSNTALEKDWK